MLYNAAKATRMVSNKIQEYYSTYRRVLQEHPTSFKNKLLKWNITTSLPIAKDLLDK